MNMRLLFRIIKKLLKYFFISFVVFNFLILIIPFLFSPKCNSDISIHKYDIIIVLGSPATLDCKPSAILKDRIDKGIVLYKKGIANKILFTGSSVHNDCTEANVMSEYAILNGIPKENIVMEDRAENTYQNAFYSVAYMKKNDLKTAAIVTSLPHIKRSCIVFSKFNVKFNTFGAEKPKNTSKIGMLFWFMGERMILSHHLVFGFPDSF